MPTPDMQKSEYQNCKEIEGREATRTRAQRVFTAGGLGPLKAPRSSGVFEAKSCILGLSWQQIMIYNKTCTVHFKNE